MKITFDKEADAAYVYLEEDVSVVDKTISLNDSINIDLDSQGRAIGIEILNASKHLTTNALKSAQLI